MGECHYLDGNVHAANKMKVVSHLLDISGIGQDRMRVRWVSAAEGQLFAEYVREYSQTVFELGPFLLRDFEPSIAAMEAALASQRLRWLMGIQVQVTDRENVYGKKLDEDTYREMLFRTSEEEYQKALVLEALRERPGTVKGIALDTGLPVFTVSCLLNDLERRHRVHFDGYEGSTPTFAAG